MGSSRAEWIQSSEDYVWLRVRYFSDRGSTLIGETLLSSFGFKLRSVVNFLVLHGPGRESRPLPVSLLGRAAPGAPARRGREATVRYRILGTLTPLTDMRPWTARLQPSRGPGLRRPYPLLSLR